MKKVICDHCGKEMELEDEVRFADQKELPEEQKESRAWVEWFYTSPTGTSAGKSAQICWKCKEELQQIICNFLKVDNNKNDN